MFTYSHILLYVEYVQNETLKFFDNLVDGVVVGELVDGSVWFGRPAVLLSCIQTAVLPSLRMTRMSSLSCNFIFPSYVIKSNLKHVTDSLIHVCHEINMLS